jgi:hypothetical protein
MGVLDDAIREHLDLKRRRGASDEEIARAEAEALTPARRPAPPAGEHDDDGNHDGADDLEHDGHDRSEDDDSDASAPRRIEPVHDVAPPPEATHAVHDIDEDPLPPAAPGHEPADDPGRLSD